MASLWRPHRHWFHGLARLEDRIALAAISLPGRAYSDTDVLAFVRAADPLVGLAGVDAAASRVVFTTPEGSLVHARIEVGARPIDVVNRLADLPGVAWAAPNYVYPTHSEFTPNDPSFPQQWHLAKLLATTAWDTTTGSSNLIVAVADDGISLNHPDLATSIWVNSKEVPGNNIDDDGNGFKDDVNGWDFYEDDNSPVEENGDTHGTHVAGIIAARTNNGVGVAGLAGGGPNGAGVRLMPVRFVANGNGTGTAADAAAAFAYAADNGARIISTSQSFDGYAGDPAVTAAVDYAYGKGVLMINSAGNNDQLDPPRKAFTQILFVAATAPDDTKTAFSNYGGFVDIAAPGLNVLSTTWDNNNTTFAYRMISGTSMAAPNAAGVAALIWSANPTWTRDQVAAQLVNTADRIDEFNPGYEDRLGFGRVNAARAVTATPPPPRFAFATNLPDDGGFTTDRNFTVTLDAPLKFDPATVSTADFELRSDGADNAFGTGDDTIVSLTLNGGAAYRVGTDAMALTWAGNLAFDRYRFTAKSAALADPFGQALDGDADGIAGGDFVRTFRIAVDSIQGRVYEDTDASLLLGNNDPRLAGWTVYLDANNNGSLDGGETSVVTDAAGTYDFLDLAKGTYTVRRVTPPGWSDNRPAGGFYTVTLSSSTSSSTGNHFGQLRTDAVYGRSYEDLNASGARDSADPPLPGRLVYLDLDGDGALDASTSVQVSADVPKAVGVGTSTSTLAVSGVTGTLTDVDVTLSLSHTAVGDLRVVLIGPGGRRVELVSGVGGETNNFTATVFDDESLTAIDVAVAPFSGKFRPAGRLVDFDGLDPNANWTLEVTDSNAFANTGALLGWALTLTTGEPQTTSDENGLFRVTAAPAGTYILRGPPPAGWRAAMPLNGDQTVTLGGPVTGANIGQWRTSAAYGRVYNDANGNAVQDGGESLLSGWRSYLDRNANGTFDAPVTKLSSTDVPLTTVDMAIVSSKLVVSGFTDPVTDLNVNLTITSPYTGEVEATLIAPDGRRVTLFRHVGIDGNNFTNTTLDDEAATSITAASPPYTGAFRPQGSLADFDGLVPNGTWRLELGDLMQSYTNVLTAWSLAIETAEPNMLSASHGGYVVANLPAAGTVRRVLQPGWGGTQPAGDAYPFAVTANETFTNFDFGVRLGPPQVASVVVNDGSSQRSRVTQLTVNFDRAVTFAGSPAAAFQLVRVGSGPVTLAVDLSASTSSRTVARLTFSGPLTEGLGSLIDGNYQLTVLAAQVSENGQPLPADFPFGLHRLFGDADGDADVDVFDYGAFRAAFGTPSVTFDFDGDGDVDVFDFGAFRGRFGTSV